MQPEYSEQWRSPAQPQQQQQWQQGVPPQWQQQPWPQQQWPQPAQRQWQQQQVQQPWQQPWLQQPWPQQHPVVRPAPPGALWLLFGVALVAAFVPWVQPIPTVVGGQMVLLVASVLLVAFAMCAPFAPKVGRVGVVVISGLALLTTLTEVLFLVIGNATPWRGLWALPWVAVLVVAFLPPVNRACRR